MLNKLWKLLGSTRAALAAVMLVLLVGTGLVGTGLAGTGLAGIAPANADPARDGAHSDNSHSRAVHATHQNANHQNVHRHAGAQHAESAGMAGHRSAGMAGHKSAGMAGHHGQSHTRLCQHAMLENCDNCSQCCEGDASPAAYFINERSRLSAGRIGVPSGKLFKLTVAGTAIMPSALQHRHLQVFSRHKADRHQTIGLSGGRILLQRSQRLRI